jgi:hypothetical protein
MDDLQAPLELTDEEKRRVLDNDRRVREQATFKSFADAFANEGRESGRFKKLDVTPIVKRLPPSSPWSPAQPRLPDEPPLGYSVDDLGLQKSGASAPVPPSVVETALDRDGAPHSVPTLPSDDTGDRR